jgi:hypothetical protein
MRHEIIISKAKETIKRLKIVRKNQIQKNLINKSSIFSNISLLNNDNVLYIKHKKFKSS